MKKIGTILLFLSILFEPLSSYAGSQEVDLNKVRSEKWGAVGLKAHLLMANGDIEEISFGGISADCNGYRRGEGIGFSEAGAETIVEWKDLKYFVPSAGIGKGTNGKTFKVLPLTLNICKDAHLYGTKPKKVNIPIFG